MIASKSKKSPLFSSKVRFIHRISKFNVNENTHERKRRRMNRAVHVEAGRNIAQREDNTIGIIDRGLAGRDRGFTLPPRLLISRI